MSVIPTTEFDKNERKKQTARNERRFSLNALFSIDLIFFYTFLRIFFGGGGKERADKL